MNKKKGIIVSGYFNPIHKGHIEYFNNAKALADELFVIVNNDYQRALKGSTEFQQEQERVFIVSNIKSVDHCILSIDQDRTVCKTIEEIAQYFGQEYELNFANGGDQIVLQQGERHRLIGLDDYSVVAEIWQHTDKENSSDEEDIIRVQDDFGR